MGQQKSFKAVDLEDEVKTIWRERHSSGWSFICPLCRSSRKIPYQPKPGGWRHFSQVALTAGVVTLATWPWFGIKGVISFIPLWMVFEAVYRSKVRVALACGSCGFDPLLYMVDIPRARREVDKFWRTRLAEKGIPYPEKPGREGEVISAPPSGTSSATSSVSNNAPG